MKTIFGKPATACLLFVTTALCAPCFAQDSGSDGGMTGVGPGRGEGPPGAWQRNAPRWPGSDPQNRFAPQMGRPGRMPPMTMSREDMERLRNMSPEERRETMRRMFDERRRMAEQPPPDPNRDIALTTSYSESAEFKDLNDATAMIWRKLTDKQRLTLSDMTQLEREAFRNNLKNYIFAPDKLTTDTKAALDAFLTEKQMSSIQVLSTRQREQALKLIDGYTTMVLLQREFAKLPDDARDALKKLTPVAKREYLVAHGYDTTMMDSLFPHLAEQSTNAETIAVPASDAETTVTAKTGPAPPGDAVTTTVTQ